MKLVEVVVKNCWWSEGARKPFEIEPRSAKPGDELVAQRELAVQRVAEIGEMLVAAGEDGGEALRTRSASSST